MSLEAYSFLYMYYTSLCDDKISLIDWERRWKGKDVLLMEKVEKLEAILFKQI